MTALERTALPQLQISLVEQLDEEIKEIVLAPLRAYNREKSCLFYEIRDLPENAPRPLNLIARDAAGKPIAGLIGETQFRWVKISLLSVSEEYRRKGVGKELMQRAEAEGLARGCRYTYVDTMDYQAPEFYKKLGYAQSGYFPDWDSHGHAKVFFIKTLR